jgi:CubicO group peptidase (beta-lactamase class C family)
LIAHAGGQSTAIEVKDDEIHFMFSSDLGSFRGQKDKISKRISGHWISEPGSIVFSTMATPLTLESTASGLWQGSVRPIEQRFSLYIKISQGESGAMRAFLRNPERNQGVSTRLHTVKRSGTQIQFADSDGNTVLEGHIDPQGNVLSVAMPSRGSTYDLTRRKRNTAPSFFPRMETAAYDYKQPMALNDGWSVANPKSVGLDQARLEQFVQSILDTETTSLRTPYIHSLLVARRGKLVLEEYFYGYHGDSPHDLRSATKSITGLMVGKMLDEIKTLYTNSTVYPLFPNASATLKPPQSALAIKHLLSMRSGFDCDDNNNRSPGNEDRMQEQTEPKDWYEYTLALPFVAAPGETAVYCTGGINLLGGIISQATGTWLPEFFRSRFAIPLQINHYHMNLDPLKRGYAGGGIHMRPRDFLKFAQLMLNDGMWNDQKVLPRDWVAQSFAAHGSIYQPDDYGYTWWRGELPAGEKAVQVLSAIGNGGQMLILVPELELAIGFTGGNYGDFRTWSAWRDKLVPKYVIEAVIHQL